MKIEAASICGTDVHILSTPPSYPANQGIVQGHEFVGRVEEVGSAVTTIKPGDRVVLDPNVFCGECYQCKKGNFNMCENVYVLGLQTMGDSGNMRGSLQDVREDIPGTSGRDGDIRGTAHLRCQCGQ